MQNYYENLYDTINIEKEGLRNADMYSFMNYRAKIKEAEFNMYQAEYGHVIHKYEKIRGTKLWKLAKKLKAKFITR